MIFQTSAVKIDDKSKNFFVYLIALILLFYGVSVGINITSFSLFLNQMGISQNQITNILSIEIAGSLIAAPLFPRLCEKYGVFLVLVTSLALRGLALMAFPMSVNLKFNIMCMFVSGLASFCTLTAIWFWGASLLKDKTRATMIAFISVAFSTGIAIGVATLFYKANKMSIDLFRTSALFSMIIIGPIFFIKNSIPHLLPKGGYAAPSKLIKHIMIPIIAIVAASYLLSAFNSFGVVYSIKSNVPYNQAILIHIYMLAGNLLLTIPLAFILDRIKSKLSFLSIVLGIICLSTILIPFIINSHNAPMIIFGLLSSLISLVLIYSISEVSSKFRDNNLLASTTLLSVMYSIGGYAGITATKASVEYWGNQGLIISVAVVSLFVLLYVIHSTSGE